MAPDPSLASVAVPAALPGERVSGSRRSLLRLPAVYRPDHDSLLLAETVAAEDIVGARVMDLCTGSGVVAVAAARAGAEEVVAIDVSRRAVLSARLNLLAAGPRTIVRRGDLFAADPGGMYDLIVSNPPYVPSEDEELPTRGPARAWDGGTDGRAIVDRICREAPRRLRPGGRMLMVHSELTNHRRTIEMLEREGLEASVVARRDIPFGPVMESRETWLRDTRLIADGPRVEQIVVVRATVPASGDVLDGSPR
ncbi:MAG: methyltransferase [Patulibacter sp.]|nr:methyltransferase [Patulibacter sp.]